MDLHLHMYISALNDQPHPGSFACSLDESLRPIEEPTRFKVGGMVTPKQNFVKRAVMIVGVMCVITIQNVCIFFGL